MHRKDGTSRNQKEGNMKRLAGLTGRQSVRRMKRKSIWERARLILRKPKKHICAQENARRKRQIEAGTRQVSD